MTDIVDTASENEERHRAAALAARPKPVMQRHMTDECISCGNPIPPERRAAIPDAARCTDCQTAHEAETTVRPR